MVSLFYIRVEITFRNSWFEAQTLTRSRKSFKMSITVTWFTLMFSFFKKNLHSWTPLVQKCTTVKITHSERIVIFIGQTQLRNFVKVGNENNKWPLFGGLRAIMLMFCYSCRNFSIRVYCKHNSETSTHFTFN